MGSKAPATKSCDTKEIMPSFEELKQKYQSVLDTIQREGGQLQNVNMDGAQLFIKAIMPSEQGKNRVWDAIKAVDQSFVDLKHDIQVNQSGGQSTSQAGQKYTVQAGDTLSKISKQFYGDAGKVQVIAQANQITNPDKIKAGQELIIPNA